MLCVSQILTWGSQAPDFSVHVYRLKKKSSMDHRGRQCIVHFDNLENMEEDKCYLTVTGFKIRYREMITD